MESRIMEVKIGDRNFPIRVFSIGQTIEGDIISPGLMATGGIDEIRKIFSRLLLLKCGENELMYTFVSSCFGDYTTPQGQNEFKDTDLVLVKEGFNPPAWAEDLHLFAALKSNKNFKADNVMACVRDLREKNGRPTFHVGPGFYSQSFFSNGSGGMNISLSAEENEKLAKVLSGNKYAQLIELSTELEAAHGKNITTREIVAKKYPDELPAFGRQIYNNSIGVSCIVLTSDNHFIYTKRGKGVSVHQGIGSSASGAAEFNESLLSKHGLPGAMAYEIGREIKEEVGLGSGTLLLGAMQKRIKLELGVDADEYDLIPVSFVRELLRGGKPELWFLVKYKGAVEDIVQKITDNRNAGKAEIDELIYAQPTDDAARMIKFKEADGFLTHVLLAELHLTVEYLMNN